MLDSPGNNAKQLTGKRLWELIDAAHADGTTIAFSTDGWMKTKLADAPVEIEERKYPVYGLYVKEPSIKGLVESITVLAPGDEANPYLFTFKATAIVWGKWLLSDSNVRAKFNRAVAYGAQDIRTRMHHGTLTPEAAAREAIDMRNIFLYEMRKKTSPSGGLLHNR